MYRTNETPTAKCPCCGEASLTPLTAFTTFHSNAQVHFKKEIRKTFDTETRDVTLNIDAARVCIACGHVALFLDAKRLAELQADAEGLTPSS